ncbi:MAG: Na+/H+ antiporter subunit E [Candidatus Cloacimonetes bacterium]|nr:Na+/H+ antiporter subunit E [Candidatus Cloacimonadota bacterium]
MKTETKSRIVVFFLSLLIWILITMVFSIPSLIAGIIMALITATFAGEMLIITERKFHLKRIWYTIEYIVKFTWELIKANFHVAYIVIHPLLPIKPGIVKVKTKLKRDSALTMLANSITLTPGTLTVDIDVDNQILYVHWIDVKFTDIEQTTEHIGGRFEKLLEEIFE